MPHPTRGPQDHHLPLQISRIQRALESQGFQIHKQTHHPTWTIHQGQQTYRLTHTPNHQWTLHPIDPTPTRQQIVAAIRTALASPSPETHRPWTITIIRSATERHTIARFRNRQDADDHLRSLHRYLPNAQLEIVFEPPQVEES